MTGGLHGTQTKKRLYLRTETKNPSFRNLMLWLLTLMFLACIAVFILNPASNNQVEYLTQRVTVENLPGDLESFSIFIRVTCMPRSWGPMGLR